MVKGYHPNSAVANMAGEIGDPVKRVLPYRPSVQYQLTVTRPKSKLDQSAAGNAVTVLIVHG